MSNNLNRESELKGEVYSALPAAIFQCALAENLHIVKANQLFYQLLGYTFEEFDSLIKKPEQPFVHRDDEKEFVKAMLDCRINGAASQVECRFLCKNDDVKWLFVSFNLVEGEVGLVQCVGLDTTRVKNNAISQKMERRAQNVVNDYSPAYFWEYYMDGDYCINGPQRVKQLNLSARMDNFPQSFIDTGIIVPEYEKEYIDIHKRLKAGEKEINVLFPSGANHKQNGWGRLRYTTVFDENGKPVKAIGSFANITLQLKMEAIYEREVAFRMSTAEDNLASFHLNLDGDICDDGISKNYDLLKLQESKKAKGFFEKLPQILASGQNKQEFAQKFNCENLISKFKSSESSISAENIITIAQGEKWVKFTVNMFQNPDDGMVEAFIYLSDIHLEKTMQLMIAKALTVNYDAIMYIDGKNNLSRAYYVGYETDPNKISVSFDREGDMPAFAKKMYFGDDVQEFIRRNSLEVIKKELENKDEYALVFSSKDAQGNLLRKRGVYSYINKTNCEILLSATDITQVYLQDKKVQDELTEAAQKAERANLAKAMLMSRVSHDVRTPMNAIAGMAALALEDVNNPAMVQESLNIISTSARHLLALINDIMDVSLAETGNMVLAREDYSLKSILQEVGEIMMPTFAAKSQNFTVDISGLIHDQFCGDEKRFGRIIINLLTNSSKFTPDGGKIKVMVKETPIDDKQCTLLVAVQDNGVGISTDKKDKIFKPFVRGSENQIGGVEGVGLGLDIVNSIVHLKKGKVWVESEESKGATFYVEIPEELSEKPLKQNEADPTDKDSALLNGLKILLAEDHPINALVAQKLLTKNGAKVTLASNGKIAYETFTSSEPGTFNMIFMDVQMPVMDGYEATKAIRASKHIQNSSIPIVAMTANVMAQDIKMAMESGMSDHVAKPINLNSIYQVVKKHIKN